MVIRHGPAADDVQQSEVVVEVVPPTLTTSLDRKSYDECMELAGSIDILQQAAASRRTKVTIFDQGT